MLSFRRKSTYSVLSELPSFCQDPVCSRVSVVFWRHLTFFLDVFGDGKTFFLRVSKTFIRWTIALSVCVSVQVSNKFKRNACCFWKFTCPKNAIFSDFFYGFNVHNFVDVSHLILSLKLWMFTRDKESCHSLCKHKSFKIFIYMVT